MKKVFVLPLLCILLVSSTAFFVSTVHENEDPEEAVDCYVGVSFCGSTTAEAELLIDRVKDYTNLFVVQSGPVSENEASMDEICRYAVDSGLDIVVYFGDLSTRALERRLNRTGLDLLWRLNWIATAEEKYGDSFLGVYYYDESGGIWLDQVNSSSTRRRFEDPTYDDIAELVNAFLPQDRGYQALKNSSINVFASDYALYWFDYKMGYDTIFAQLGWNHTQKQDIALIRGAATVHNKSWGTIITWKYNHLPYLDTAKNIYNQMRTSYEAGADYIVIFNYPTNLTDNKYGAMTDAHFEALETFWKYTVQNPKVVHGSTKAEAALVLPKNYGWGMRNPNDTIWGLWGPDENSEQIWAISRMLLTRYGTALDIVYDDPDYPYAGNYQQIYLWNQTITSNP